MQVRQLLVMCALVLSVACGRSITAPAPSDPVVPTPPTVSDPAPGETPTPTPTRRVARGGLVGKAGREFVDTNGVFSPLGETLFWALRGWKFERERAAQNIDDIAKSGADYIRVFGQVDWKGLETSPDWPDYTEQLASLIDYVYESGMRTQITVLAGPYHDPLGAARKVADVVRTRPEKVMFLEVCNEGWQNCSGMDMEGIGRFLLSQTPNLVAITAPAEEQATPVSASWISSGSASMGTGHFDRTDSTVEWKWRHVRKPWESRSPSFPASHNEPGGPRSSVAQFEEPIHLVMSRAVGILTGYTGYVLHNGAGIFGVPMAVHGGRPSNVWEIPQINEIRQALRALDRILPPNPSLGVPTRAGLGPHPLGADAFVIDHGRGVVRDYAIVRGDGTFWQTLFGLKDHVVLTSDAAYELEIINPLTGEVEQRRSVQARESFRLEPGGARDSRGWGAYIIKGRRQ